MNLKNKFCAKPFTYLEIGYPKSDGKVLCHACCPNQLPKEVGDLSRDSINEIWNSKAYQDIRSSILDGSFKYCDESQCPEIQTNSLPDRDIVTDKRLRKIINEGLVELELGPEVLNLSYDQTCNLACPSCRVDFISSNDQSSQDVFTKIGYEVLNTTADNVKRVLFCSSGDPFSSQHFKSLLQELDFKKNPELRIQIVTNGVLFTEKMWDELQNIHGRIDLVCISIDAAKKDTYEIVRKGGDWHKLLKNLEFIKSLRKKGLIPFLKFDFVVQDYNFKEMPAFALLGKKFGADKVFFQRIINWGTYSEEVFLERAVYREAHPSYEKFVKVCKSNELKDEIVDGGNLSSFIGEPIRKFRLTKAIEHSILKRLRRLKRILLR
ncbi:hypothetical protein A9Q84_19300 [Halobacteriovorax marinus]|uniref:Radical SAM core domain-containing protein n=1 Tax=Halobacteriovorax marinus TaxID=97084 RepID=A0A1Y5F7V5_9BACT|nr:hypothetical protein A9Q84_19300 [Halobacteriovorax marinus]